MPNMALGCALCHIRHRDHTPSTILSMMYENKRCFNWFIVVYGAIQTGMTTNVNTDREETAQMEAQVSCIVSSNLLQLGDKWDDQLHRGEYALGR